MPMTAPGATQMKSSRSEVADIVRCSERVHVRRGSPLVGRGSPDPAAGATAGLPSVSVNTIWNARKLVDEKRSLRAVSIMLSG